MNEITLQSIEAYDKDFQSFGACPKGVGWGNAKNIRKDTIILLILLTYPQ